MSDDDWAIAKDNMLNRFFLPHVIDEDTINGITEP